MTVIGLTGTTGAGKGELAKIFEKNGIPTLDTDKVSHIVYKKEQKCHNEIVAHFGQDILDKNGEIDRKALANIVFMSDNSKHELAVLSKIAHKYILEYADAWLAEKNREGYKIAVVDAPQLFESGYNKKCDHTVAVLADTELRIKRITARDSITRSLAENRIAKQYNDDYFLSNCGTVFYNNGTKEELEIVAMPYINKLLQESI